MKSILIVGYGSIGQRHAKNFKNLGCAVSIVSRRQLETTETVYSSIEHAFQKQNFDFVFICSETVSHAESLDVLLSLGFSGLVIVEKPIFDLSVQNYEKYKGLNIRVSYNLRFNPLLKTLKSELKNQKILSAHVYAGQYLPSWRPKADYRKSYSAFTEKGGGVLLDLSHELDFCQWLFGKDLNVLCQAGKWSSLEIQSMDTCGLMIRYEKCPLAMIQLNYTDHITQRFIIVNTDTDTYKLDFIQKELYKNKTQLTVEESDSYMAMSKNILEERAEGLTSFSESLRLMDVMQLATNSALNSTPSNEGKA